MCRFFRTVMNGAEFGVNGMTDLFVSDELLASEEMFNLLRSKDLDYIVRRVPELANDGDLYQLLTYPTDKGGFGMMMPLDTKHLIFGFNRNRSSDLVLRKTNMSIYIDGDSPSSQWAGEDLCIDGSDTKAIAGRELRGKKTSGVTHSQTVGFYGWLSVIIATANSDMAVLGAV